MQTSKPGKSIYIKLGVWYDEGTGHIHLASNEIAKFHTTVCDAKVRLDGTLSRRGHANLFAKLARLLKAAGAPHPDLANTE